MNDSQLILWSMVNFVWTAVLLFGSATVFCVIERTRTEIARIEKFKRWDQEQKRKERQL